MPRPDPAPASADPGVELATARAAIPANYRPPEAETLRRLAPLASLEPPERTAVVSEAAGLLAELRNRGKAGWLERFLQEYRLSSEEGAALLGLAEAFLRVPDAATADALIRDKLSRGDWRAHLGSDSAVVNGATMGLVLARALAEASAEGGTLRSLVARVGEPAVRAAVGGAMQRMGEAFVLGRTIGEALARADRGANRAFRYSFDMLGEAARTSADAAAYLDAYAQAVAALGRDAAAAPNDELTAADSISVKLSALHPRYEPLQAPIAVQALAGSLIDLARAAREAGVGLTVDAEEAERLEMSLDIIEAAARDPSLAGWDGLGMAVQAYQKRAFGVIHWAGALARATGRRLMVRLVKGAYWDTEIKRAQERGLADYPVFTRKAATDVSYLACAKALLDQDSLYPAFATHNALTVATVLHWASAGDQRAGEFEFQRLHGMGEGLYETLMAERGLAVRVYAPVGGYRELLAYLVRRLLENGANTSFVHQVADREVSDAALLADPVESARAAGFTPHPAIPRPPDLFAPARRNSAGLDISDVAVLADLRGGMSEGLARGAEAAPLIAGKAQAGMQCEIVSPADRRRVVGRVVEAAREDVERALGAAADATTAWAETEVETRAAALERLADRLEAERATLVGLICAEAGRTIPDALSEVREAVDFCRYYAAQARRVLSPTRLPGPTGELNELRLAPRGVFAAVSPWNFPLSIFIGQAAAALVTGNTVIAKSAPQTPLVAAAAVRLALEAGIPGEALTLLPGGPHVGAALVGDRRISGVVFTGSTGTARAIARTLLEDETRPLVPLIAETGGVNAMLVDSTALPEQVVGDAIASAFGSAGQRCSALRLLCLHEDAAERTLLMLAGAMDALVVGDPADPLTDVGPVIDAAARDRLEAHKAHWRGRILHETALGSATGYGTFVAPTLIRLDRIEDLDGEVFGPILHVATFGDEGFEGALQRVMASGFGLTLGVHSRIGSAAETVRARARVGNLYVNRTMIGAVVGVQPFGGEGLSGTGPKAGGPHYLPRFCVERTYTVDTTSAGGNATLLSLAE